MNRPEATRRSQPETASPGTGQSWTQEIPLAQAYIVIGEMDTALAAIEQGLEVGGPKTADFEGYAVELRREIAKQKRLQRR